MNSICDRDVRRLQKSIKSIWRFFQWSNKQCELPAFVFALCKEKNVSNFPGATDASGFLLDMFLTAMLLRCRKRFCETERFSWGQLQTLCWHTIWYACSIVRLVRGWCRTNITQTQADLNHRWLDRNIRQFQQGYAWGTPTLTLTLPLDKSTSCKLTSLPDVSYGIDSVKPVNGISVGVRVALNGTLLKLSISQAVPKMTAAHKLTNTK